MVPGDPSGQLPTRRTPKPWAGGSVRFSLESYGTRFTRSASQASGSPASTSQESKVGARPITRVQPALGTLPCWRSPRGRACLRGGVPPGVQEVGPPSGRTDCRLAVLEVGHGCLRRASSSVEIQPGWRRSTSSWVRKLAGDRKEAANAANEDAGPAQPPLRHAGTISAGRASGSAAAGSARTPAPGGSVASAATGTGVGLVVPSPPLLPFSRSGGGDVAPRPPARASAHGTPSGRRGRVPHLGADFHR